MFTKFWQNHNIATGILTVLRIWLGYQWLTAGWGKITGGFGSGGYLQNAASLATGDHPAVAGWWATFLENFAIPNAALFDILIPYGEFLVGLGLLLGALTRSAAFFGLVMNMAFLLSGTVSTNPTMLIVSVLILVAGYNAGKIGVDGLFLRRFVETKIAHRSPNRQIA
ncbi:MULTISPECIES: DoxX family membrane protein [unclassified Exiguobacterium]|uniref:DoxX family membrane protein n=1 Tax=unclassified Exiguobacterium TaxID=2644629 RepID=UPI00103F600B|nr:MULTISPECIES: DoxX family membrane protein [unclassified Exiguobacterium]TCI34529.1 DoxX family membrane protein [Exiguobacterium sp. SH4S7]TCI60603.1 DoxX family membrane protein [Exiguobacterium sp. SH0S2]